MILSTRGSAFQIISEEISYVKDAVEKAGSVQFSEHPSSASRLECMHLRLLSLSGQSLTFAHIKSKSSITSSNSHKSHRISSPVGPDVNGRDTFVVLTVLGGGGASSLWTRGAASS